MAPRGRPVPSTTVAACVAVCALALAACADDGPPSTAAAVPDPTAPATVPVTTAPPAGADGDPDAGDAGADRPTDAVVPIATVVVQSLDNIFRPEVIEIEVGTEVVWVNVGRTDHDVTPADPTATWGVGADRFQPGDEYRFVFTEPGVHDYYCSIHGTATAGQIGSVVVVADTTSA